MAKWIDFKQLREDLDFKQVLDDYGVELKQKPNGQAQGFCPLPDHNGKRNSPSFSVNLDKGIFHCFGCQARGNVLDFAVRMEGLDPDSRQAIREAAEILDERYQSGSGSERSKQPRKSRRQPGGQRRIHGDGEDEQERSADKAQSQRHPPTEDTEPTVVEDEPVDHRVNAPLNFSLKRLDPHHPYLTNRGLTSETVEQFGLGFCNRGLMKGRIAIPLHNPEGHLVGYVGRLVDDEQIGENQPKYRFPGTRDHEGVRYEFRKSELVFNAHRVDRPSEQLIVVEGFFDCLWLHQCGYTNTVALMGTTCSDEQADIIADLTTEDAGPVIMPDGDKAGRQGVTAWFQHLGTRRFVRWAVLAPDQQPTDLHADELETLLGESSEKHHHFSERK